MTSPTVGDGTPASASGLNAFTAPFWNSMIRSDEPYGEAAARSLGDRFLYVSDIALGRVVETPDEIVQALQTYVTYGGRLDIETATVLGYDFLSDGSEEIADVLERSTAVDGTPLPVDRELASGGPGDGWTKDDAIDKVVEAGRNALVSLNAHFDHYRALPAIGDKDPLFTDNLLASNLATEVADVLGDRALEQSLIFSMGCHSGLSVSDITIGATTDDWAQTLSDAGSLYVGNTGYGYGDTKIGCVHRAPDVAVRTAGHLALRPRRRNDRCVEHCRASLDLGQERVRLGAPGLQRLRREGRDGVDLLRSPVLPGRHDPGPAPRTGRERAGARRHRNGVDPADRPDGGCCRSCLDELRHDVLRQHRRRWRRTRHRSAGSADPAQAGERHLGHRSSQPDGTRAACQGRHRPRHGIDIRPRGEPGDQLADLRWWSITSGGDRGRGGLPHQAGRDPTSTSGPAGSRQTLVVATGQYDSETKKQRLDSDIDVVVYYADPDELDVTAPTIQSVTSSISGSVLTVSLAAGEASAPTEVDRVYVLVAQNPGSLIDATFWTGLDLVRVVGTNVWTGSLNLEPNTTSVELTIQAKDQVGNVGYATNKARNFAQPVVTPPAAATPADPADGRCRGAAALGWYEGSATISVPVAATDVTYSINGVSMGRLTPPASFDIGGNGVQNWTVTTVDGKWSATGSVNIDSDGPPDVSFGAPVADGVYVTGTRTLSAICADASVPVCDYTIAPAGGADSDHERQPASCRARRVHPVVRGGGQGGSIDERGDRFHDRCANRSAGARCRQHRRRPAVDRRSGHPVEHLHRSVSAVRHLLGLHRLG